MNKRISLFIKKAIVTTLTASFIMVTQAFAYSSTNTYTLSSKKWQAVTVSKTTNTDKVSYRLNSLNLYNGTTGSHIKIKVMKEGTVLMGATTTYVSSNITTYDYSDIFDASAGSGLSFYLYSDYTGTANANMYLDWK